MGHLMTLHNIIVMGGWLRPDFLNAFIFVYIDDILIYSWNLHEHQLHVHKLLQ